MLPNHRARSQLSWWIPSNTQLLTISQSQLWLVSDLFVKTGFLFFFFRNQNVTDPVLKNLSEGLKTLTSLRSINLDFMRQVTFFNGFLDLSTVATNSQIKVSKLSLKVSKALVPYNLSFSNLHGKWLLFDNFCKLTNSCDQITDQGLTNLGEGFKTLHSNSLLSLHLDFD